MINLKPYNTFHIEAYCTQFYPITDTNQIPELIQQGVFNFPFLILGGGSNVLFTQDFEGTVIRMETKGIQMIAENTSKVYLKVAAGEDWEDLIQYCVDHEYYGVENLTAIPGKVGSSPVQNIGAYGVEVKDTIFQVHAISLENGQKKIFTNEQCHFGYRESIFKKEQKNRWIITDVIFELSKIKHFNFEYAALKNLFVSDSKDLTIKEVREKIVEVRDSKLPNVEIIGSAGSFFKNPVVSLEKFEELHQQYPNLTHFPFEENRVKLAAGQLIDLCGWKGYREGDAGVYPKQALVLVNYGNAKGDDIVQLYKKIQKSVFEQFQVEIVLEVNIV